MGDQREGGFRYTHRGRAYPSVTTILGAAEPKPWMGPYTAREVATWAVKNRAEWEHLEEGDAIAVLKRGAEKHRTAAASLGSAVHLYAEAQERGEEVQVPKDLLPFCKSFMRFLADWKPEPIATELKVYNTRIGYAGTFDSWCRIPRLGEEHGHGPVVLLDYKSGKGVYASVALQLAAYARAEFIQDEATGEELPMPPPPDAFYAIHLRPRGYALIRVKADDPEVWRAFRAMCAIRHWVENVEPHVLARV